MKKGISLTAHRTFKVVPVLEFFRKNYKANDVPVITDGRSEHPSLQAGTWKWTCQAANTPPTMHPPPSNFHE